MKITSRQPGNIFYSNEEVIFSTSSNSSGKYIITDQKGSLILENDLPSMQVIKLGYIEPGYYELHCRCANKEARISFGVLCDTPTLSSDFIGINIVIKWLSLDSQINEIAALLEKAGINWVRERISWGEIEPERGKFNWSIYNNIINTFVERGIKIVEVFQDSPLWSHPADSDLLSPGDLRDVYKFAEAAANNFGNKVEVWEVWNEADSVYWPELSDRFAGLQKAAYLGFKSVNPELTILLSSLCKGANSFAKNLLSCDIDNYFDNFNIHTYVAPEEYHERINHYTNLLLSYEAADHPVWITEAGIYLIENIGELSRQDQILQAEFITKSIIMALTTGVDKYFYFLLPSYIEGNVQFGCIKPDLSPRPGFIALSVCARILGKSNYLGRYDHHDRNVQIHFIDDGQEGVAVAWSNRSRIIKLVVSSPVLTMADIFGKQEELLADNGSCKILLTPSPQYIYGLKIINNKEDDSQIRRVFNKNVSSVVVRCFADGLHFDRKCDCYIITLNIDFTLNVELYNFSEDTITGLEIFSDIPGGWSANRLLWQGDLAPMERKQFKFNLCCKKKSNNITPVKITARVNEKVLSCSVSYFSIETATHN